MEYTKIKWNDGEGAYREEYASTGDMSILGLFLTTDVVAYFIKKNA